MDENSVDRVWDIPDDSDFFHQEVRSLEYRAYGSLISAFRARGELNEERRTALNVMREALGISEVRHKCEVRRVATNPRLAMIANKIQGYNTTQDWIDEGFCDLPYPSVIPRLPYAPAKLPESVSEELEKDIAEVAKESKLRPTIRDFRKAQKIEKNFPSTLLNGWISSDEDGKRIQGKGKSKTPRRISISKRQRKLSHPVPDSETDDEISYKDLRRQGRIHVPKNYKEDMKAGEPISAIDPARFKEEYQVSPIRIKEEDESDETPTMHDAFVPKRKIVATKSKSLETIGASRTKKQKQIKVSSKLDRDTAEIPQQFSELDARIVATTEIVPPRSGRGRGRGSRGAGTRGTGRKSASKVLLPTSKRKHLDEARVELRSDGESDKEEGQEEHEQPSSAKTPNGYRHEFSSTESLTVLAVGSPEGTKASDHGSPILEIPKPEEPDAVQQKNEIKNSSSGDEMMKPRPVAPKPLIVRPPFPPPVFSTTLDVNSFNKKRSKFGEGEIPTSIITIGPTASSLARRPHLLTTSQGVIIRSPGILPQRKAQPHILANSKTQRLITSPLPSSAATVVQNSGVNPNSIVASGPNIVSVQSLQFVPSEHSLPLPQQQIPVSSSVVTVAGSTAKPPQSFNIPMSTMQSISFSTSATTGVPAKPQGSPSIILLQKPGGTPMPITSLPANPAGPALNANIQYSTINLQKGNNHRAVILRRANLPLNKGNVMILNSPADVALLSNLQHGSATGTQIGRIVPGSLPQSIPGSVSATFSSSPIVFSSPIPSSTPVSFTMPITTIASPIISSFAPTFEASKLQDTLGAAHHLQEWSSPTEQEHIQSSTSKESVLTEGQISSNEDTVSAKSVSQETVKSSSSQPNLTQALDDYLGSLLSTEEMPEEATDDHPMGSTHFLEESVVSLPMSADETDMSYTEPAFIQSSLPQFQQEEEVHATVPPEYSTPSTFIQTAQSDATNVPEVGNQEEMSTFVQDEHIYMEPDHTEVIEEEVVATEDGLEPDVHGSSSFDSLNFNFDPPSTEAETSNAHEFSNVGATENVFANQFGFDCIIPGDHLMTSDDVAVELEIAPEDVETIPSSSTAL